MAYLTNNHSDFRSRIKRVDPTFYRWGQGRRYTDATQKRPVFSVLLGFGWAYLVVSIASNRGVLESSLKQGSLSSGFHDAIFMALTVLLAVSMVALGVHIMRLMGRRGGKRSNSGAMLTGVLGALMLVYTPASVWQTGYGMMDGNSRAFVQAASDALPSVDLGSAIFVSSLGK